MTLYEFPVDPRSFIRQLIADTVSQALDNDLGQCGWYLRQQGVEGYEDAICSFGCVEEPSCQTCVPEGGWPSEDPDYDEWEAFGDLFIEDLLENAVVHVDLGMNRGGEKP